MGLLEYLMGEEEPFWLKRAKGQTNSPYINQMYLEHPETGNPQTIYSATHPTGNISTPPYKYTPGENTEAIMYPTIRFRSPGFLERLNEGQAHREAMQKKDYLTFPTLWDANIYAGNTSKNIKRKKKKR